MQNIRKLKARMEAERLPRGVRRERHLKLGKGGLSDVEWTVQLMQLQHAGDIKDLRVNGTLEALDVLGSQEAHQRYRRDSAAQGMDVVHRDPQRQLSVERARQPGRYSA